MIDLDSSKHSLACNLNATETGKFDLCICGLTAARNGEPRYPKVLNRAVIKTTPEGAVFVGRPTKWGNPFKIGQDGTRDEVIAKYREMLAVDPGLVQDARRELRGKNLVCWCAPLPCHADILLEVANAPIETTG